MREAVMLTAKFNRQKRRIRSLEETLRRIIAQETPTANATVKRRVKLAREELSR